MGAEESRPEPAEETAEETTKRDIERKEEIDKQFRDLENEQNNEGAEERERLRDPELFTAERGEIFKSDEQRHREGETALIRAVEKQDVREGTGKKTVRFRGGKSKKKSNKKKSNKKKSNKKKFNKRKYRKINNILKV